MDHAAHAKRLRDRAEECRVLAGIVQSAEGRAAYLTLAASYDVLAFREDTMARIGADLANVS